MKKEKNCRLGKVGGQAVLEGIMMKSGENVALCVRKEDGTIEMKKSKHYSLIKKHKFCNIPILRGCIAMVESMMLSFSTLSDSANMLGIDETEDESKFEKWLRRKFGDKLMGVIMGIGVVLGIALSLLLFIGLPTLVTNGIDSLCWHFGKFHLPNIVQTLISGVMKIIIFVSYILLVSLMKDIRTTFEYHGAEHKTIACYEEGDELTPENAMKHSRFHPRCGTSFIIVMLIISIVLTAFIQWDWHPLLIMLVKFAMLPLIVGVGYEFLMLAGKHPNALTRILSAPGLWMQRATTKEPTLSQLEVAIKAMKNSMPDQFPEVVEEEAAEETATDADNAEEGEKAESNEETAE